MACEFQNGMDIARQEVMEYQYLMDRYNSIPLKEDGREAYLINMDWMEKWRHYSCYHQIIRGQNPTISGPDHFETNLPARINNETLLMNQKAFYCIPDESMKLYLIFLIYRRQIKEKRQQPTSNYLTILCRRS